jgi:hypothetical protein
VGIREILAEFLKEAPPEVRSILADVIVAERERIDMQRPRGIKERLKDIIDAQVVVEERSR